MKKLLTKLMFIITFITTALTFGQASFTFTSKPTEFHPDGTLAASAPITFIVSNIPNDANNAINLRLYAYPDGVIIADAPTNIGWTSTTDKVNMTMGLLNDADVNNGYYKTETIDNEDGTFTKTYTISNILKNHLGNDTYKNGGIIDGENYAPIVRLVQANKQPRINNSGEIGVGNGKVPLTVDQATLDQSPDYVTSHFVFSYFPPEENSTEYPHITANSSIDLFGSDTGSEKEYQIITFSPISKQSSTTDPFIVSASASSGLTDIIYTIESGPATITDNILTLDGTAGIVTLKALQPGNSNYHEAEKYIIFDVIDLSTYYPTVTTRLSEDYPLEMPSLYAYPIYVSAFTEETDFIALDHVEIKVNGTSITVTGENNLYYALWTPNAYGNHTIDITTYTTNGNSTTITRNINVTSIITNQNVQTMDDVVIEINTENNRWYYGKFTMPQHIGSYDQIIGNMLVECPSSTGDCDDWDRWAHIDVMGPDGNWIQIIRYITPYGVGCNHSIDLTDYASLLQGEVEFRMFIDTLGSGGWQISLDFDFEQGTPQYLYSNVDELWDGSWDLGNPDNLQPVNVVNYSYDSNVVSSHLRLSTTGHGWGSNNSQNAAEFYNATNYIDIDGIQNYTQNLWNDCDPNPDNCLNQKGSWTHSRAGWCPGAISPPNIVDMTAQISKGTIDFGYRFDPTYVDYCHPNNSDCITGTTCDDCNDGFKAQYVIDGQLINYSNTPLIQGTLSIDEIDNTSNYELQISPNPTNGVFKVSTSATIGKSVMHILSVSGEMLKTYYFNSSEELNEATFNTSSLSKGIYFITIENNAGQGNLKLIIK